MHETRYINRRLFYLQCPLLDFRPTFVIGASWDKDELIKFWGQKGKGQGHIIAADVSSSRRYHQFRFLVLYLGHTI